MTNTQIVFKQKQVLISQQIKSFIKQILTKNCNVYFKNHVFYWYLLLWAYFSLIKVYFHNNFSYIGNIFVKNNFKLFIFQHINLAMVYVIFM